MVGISFKGKAPNIVFLETYSSYEDYKNTQEVKISLESLIAFCIYKFCSPRRVHLKFIVVNKAIDNEAPIVTISDENLVFIDANDVPSQVASCVYPVVLSDDVILCGLCAVVRHICKFRHSPLAVEEHEDGLLGFRHSCLQAPNEVSIWTKFCEIDIISTIKNILTTDLIKEVPINLVRYENHLKKPVRVHNVYKIARDIKKEKLSPIHEVEKNTVANESELTEKESGESERVPKTRKWKSKKQKELEIDCSTKIEDLEVYHLFAEGPFLTLADLVLLPSYHIIIQSFGEPMFESLLPYSYKWYKRLVSIPELSIFLTVMNKLSFNPLTFDNISVPDTENVSLYKCDPKRHNPKKRLFTKQVEVEAAFCYISEDMELELRDNDLEFTINWNEIPDSANPTGGHLPDARVLRKTQQLENIVASVLTIVKEGDVIVDFCCGSGHLGVLLAYLLPKCTVILLENKEQSLSRAKERALILNLKNVYFYQCNLDFFNEKFDLGIGLHACGIATDLVLDKCLKSKAKFVLCPCCYGSVHATDRIKYPRSEKFKRVPLERYLCISHAADQTHEDHPLAVRGARCMVVIDSDRGRLAEENGYNVTLSRLKPLSCTLKNNLLIGVPYN